MKIISVNKSASFEYFIEDRYEAGVVLEGSEVKSLRKNNCNLSDSFCFIRNGEVLLKNMHIAVYDKSGAFNTRESRRDRKLLLHKEEIAKISGKVNEKGYTLVPLKIYFSQALVKVEVGLCRGKHTFDKKKSLQEKDLVREKERQIKEYLK
ncbi:SsrA-binding protein SmpB [Candidatus Borkfalkia ceftriaxoniphila]|jgi:ssrA-binding protein|uniref:SsrA-binding protein n=1 Tax=Candidatus Borkfalkia ceftriaxoniphila TaxID=2508949 RepID=A0A4Q2KCB5_9FIRM|nr:SsrA-binding protein SmpB [Candidatus Borkfalkia ceftriaxoniphila]RXZ61142.1 SsrA-binding protein SmpB [Candidatus Borkfalkia ceftriaxoniphila]